MFAEWHQAQMQKLEAASAEADVAVDVCGAKRKFVFCVNATRSALGGWQHLYYGRRQGVRRKNLPSVW